MKKRKTIDALTGLRGIAALWVVLFHLGPELITVAPALSFLSPLAEAGYLGVDLFFALSGYVLARRYEAGIPDLGRYLQRRIARIFPLHAAVLAALTVGALAAAPLGFPNFAAHELWRFDAWWPQLFLVQAWVGSPEAWNLPTWSLSCEWAGYLVLPFLLPRCRPRPGRAAMAALVLLSAGLTLGDHVYGTWDLTLDGGLLRFAVDFGVGALSWYATARAPLIGRGADLIAIALPVSLWLAPEPQVIVPMLVAWPATLALSHGPVAEWLARPNLGRLGRASFALYIVHEVVALVITSLWPVSSLQGPAARMGWLATLAASITAATIVGYFLVEKPSHRWLTSMRFPREAHR